MTNYQEILRLASLGINNSQIAVALGCSRTTVITVQRQANEIGLTTQTAVQMTNRDLSRLLFPPAEGKREYKMPDYDYVHKEMAKSGVTLQLLWFGYCDACAESGDIPYQLTQFKKYYREYLARTKATMHIPRNPDNLKTGVDKVTKSETILNHSYQEMSQHYDTAIIPARVRAPKDKASVEGTVGIITRWILADIRDQQFLSLGELNGVIREKLREFNNKPFQKKDGSRASLFDEERTFLLPLPDKPYEYAVLKVATVQYNYYISIDGQNYSVPYEFIKRKVDVRLTKNIVEVLCDNERICSHKRLYGRPNQYSTDQAHMPPNHKKHAEWNGERFRAWASKIGKNTATIIESMLTVNRVEQQGYKSCMALLKLADKYTAERLEAACAKALSYSVRPNYKSIAAILTSGYEQLTDSSFESLGFEDRFGLIVDAQWNEKNSNRLTRLIKNAGYDIPGACIEDIEYHPDRKLDKTQIARLATCRYIEEHHNIIIMGATGNGKTYLSNALGIAANRNFLPVRYVRLPDIALSSA